MISRSDYRAALRTEGRNLGEIRKNSSDVLQNATFDGDIGFRKVYILDPVKGWHYEDAKFSRHANVSLSKDNVDSYLQFRPKVHYPIGTYVFIPDDTGYDLEINYDNPLYSGAKNLWFIVERNNDRQFVRYLVIKCDWMLKWVIDLGTSRKVLKCWGSAEAASSYTSGVWTDYRITSLDNLSAYWLPNTFDIYGKYGIEKYGLQDTRTIKISTRFMITTNVLDPKVWVTTKILQMNPRGVLKLSIKQDDFNAKRDNPDLMVCDYYTDEGDVQVQPETPETPITETHTSEIKYQSLNEDGYLEDADMPMQIYTATAYYFKAVDSDGNGIKATWRVQFDGYEDNSSMDDYVHLTKVDDSTVLVKLSRTRKVDQQILILSVSDGNEDYKSSVNLGVIYK